MMTRRNMILLAAGGLGTAGLSAKAGSKQSNRTVKIAEFDASGKKTGDVEVEKIVKPDSEWKKQLTGEQFSAQDALDWGVLSYVVPRAELDSKLDWLLSRITDKSPTAIRLGKQAFNAMRDMSLRESLEYAQAMVPVMSSTQDAKEGMAAFQEKRAPNFTGT